jgi:hypothetical protein
LKTYQHPDTKEIRTVDEKNDVQVAALEKLGYKAITAEDITGEPSLSVTYETVTDKQESPEPPALPKLTTPIAPGPTRDPGAPKQATPGAVTREDVEPPKK